MEQKKYMSIDRLGHKNTIGVLNEGDPIIIQEKIDGANASFRKVKDAVVAYSRRQVLSEENTLGGFYQFVQDNVSKDIPENLIFYGEWTNPHKVKYPMYEKMFFLFDVYDEVLGEYLPFSDVRIYADKLNLHIVPVFYEGQYKSFQHLESYIGKTELGGRLNGQDVGEGIVVKNTNYKNRFGEQKFVKLVSDSFREVQKQKPAKNPQIELTQEQIFVSQTVVLPRIEKFLHKFVDEGILEQPFGIEDIGTILKHMNTRIKEDILQEEGDMLPEFYDEKQLTKAISRTVVKLVKPILDK